MPIKLSATFHITSHLLRAKKSPNDEETPREERFKELFNEYAQQYPKLMESPSWRLMCEQMVRMYMEIERMWKWLENLWVRDTNGRKEYKMWFKELRDAIRTWNLVQTRMGTTFTAQPYIPTKDREVKTAKEIANVSKRIETIKIKMEARAKPKKKKKSHRVNPHRGRRQAKNGSLADQEEKKLEQEAAQNE